MEVKTYNQYNKKSDIKKLLLTALTEPFVFHPFVVWSGVKGYIDKIQKKSSWGEMTRQGLNGNAKPVATITKKDIEQRNRKTVEIDKEAANTTALGYHGQ